MLFLMEGFHLSDGIQSFNLENLAEVETEFMFP